MSLSARTVLVTGASRGLGLEFVEQLLKSSSPIDVLIAACRDPAKATGLHNIAKNDPRLKIIKLAVDNDDDLEEAFQETNAAVGERGLNLLINNAGIYDRTVHGKLTDIKRETMQNHFNVNVSGPIMVAQKFLPLITHAARQSSTNTLSASRAGIIMVSSMMGSQGVTEKQGNGECLHYKCSKTAMTMASILIARELKDAGVFVAALHPGQVRTDMGHPQAPLDKKESIEACLGVIGAAGENFQGKLVSFDGKVIPY